jgi:hypothetical protein
MALGGRLDRVGVVVDRALEERRLAVVAHARPARPPDGRVAGLGDLEQAPVLVAPRDREDEHGALLAAVPAQVALAGRRRR